MKRDAYYPETRMDVRSTAIPRHKPASMGRLGRQWPDEIQAGPRIKASIGTPS